MKKSSIPEESFLYFASDFLGMNFKDPSIKKLYGQGLENLFLTLNTKYLRAIITPLLLKEETFWKQVSHLTYICHAGQLNNKSYKYIFRKQTRNKAKNLLHVITQGFNKLIFPNIKRRGRPKKQTPKWVFELHDKLTNRLTREIGALTKQDKLNLKRRSNLLNNFLENILPKLLKEPLNPFPDQASVNFWVTLPTNKLASEIIRYYLRQKGKTNIAIDERTLQDRFKEKEIEEQYKRDLAMLNETNNKENG